MQSGKNEASTAFGSVGSSWVFSFEKPIRFFVFGFCWLLVEMRLFLWETCAMLVIFALDLNACHLCTWRWDIILLKHNVHETFYCWNIRNISHFLSLFLCFKTHLFWEMNSLLKRYKSPFGIVYAKSYQYFINIINLWKSKYSFVSVSKQLDPRNIGCITKIFHCKVSRQPNFH